MTDLMDRPFLYQEAPDDQPDETDRGLVYDLATLDRRRMLKLLGLGGISAGLFTIVGCNPSASARPRRDGARAARQGAARPAAPTRRRASHPRGDRRPVPGRRLERPRRAEPERRRPPGHPLELRVVDGHRRRAFRCRSSSPSRTPRRTARRSPARPSTSGTATGTGNYSLYSQGAADENYLRGVQAADDDGVVTFQSIFPACYPGRWPHIHFEVYPSLEHRDRRGEQDRDLPDRAAEGRLRPGLRDHGLRARASRTWASSACQTDMVFGDDGGVHQLGTIVRRGRGRPRRRARRAGRRLADRPASFTGSVSRPPPPPPPPFSQVTLKTLDLALASMSPSLP